MGALPWLMLGVTGAIFIPYQAACCWHFCLTGRQIGLYKDPLSFSDLFRLVECFQGETTQLQKAELKLDTHHLTAGQIGCHSQQRSSDHWAIRCYG